MSRTPARTAYANPFKPSLSGRDRRNVRDDTQSTALTFFQALAQEAAKDTYQSFKKRLRPGDYLPDDGIDRAADENTHLY